jgi:hypothetical protein
LNDIHSGAVLGIWGCRYRFRRGNAKQFSDLV